MGKQSAVLRDKSAQELQTQLVELRRDLAKGKSHSASGTKAEKPAKIRTMRREIARVLTIMREKRVNSKG